MMTKIQTNKSDWFPSYNIRVFTPEGTLFVLITVNHEKDPFLIQITGPKNGQPLQIWATAVANMINEMWKAGIHTSTIIRTLDTPYTPKYAQNSNGVRIYSGPDGIKYALTQFLQMKNNPSWDFPIVGDRVG